MLCSINVSKPKQAKKAPFVMNIQTIAKPNYENFQRTKTTHSNRIKSSLVAHKNHTPELFNGVG